MAIWGMRAKRVISNFRAARFVLLYAGTKIIFPYFKSTDDQLGVSSSANATVADAFAEGNTHFVSPMFLIYHSKTWVFCDRL